MVQLVSFSRSIIRGGSNNKLFAGGRRLCGGHINCDSLCNFSSNSRDIGRTGTASLGSLSIVFYQRLSTFVRLFYSSSKKMPGQLEEVRGKRATFGMGCFWAGDSLFGVQPGVFRTCVGYAGGTKESPTYKNIGDHTEVIDIEYDPNIISYTQLLSLFWNNHEYSLVTKIKRQYMSLILYHDEEQKSLAEKSRDHEQKERGEVFITEIRKFEKFYPAEDYHQKYRLQHHPWLMETTGLTTGEELCTSSLAAKLNGYIAGAGTIEQFKKDLPNLGLSDKAAKRLEKYVIEKQGTGLYC